VLGSLQLYLKGEMRRPVDGHLDELGGGSSSSFLLCGRSTSWLLRQQPGTS
jgi:hypothetical protein